MTSTIRSAKTQATIRQTAVSTFRRMITEQYLIQTMNTFGNAGERLTPEQAAESLWNEFIGNAGIAYD